MSHHNTTAELVSFARMSLDWGAAYHVLRQAARRAGASPAIKLNGIEYFDAADVAAIRQEVRRLQPLSKA
jgi:hypothetical protein